jgi:hydroxyacylglutathione hydrolase
MPQSRQVDGVFKHWEENRKRAVLYYFKIYGLLTLYFHNLMEIRRMAEETKVINLGFVNAFLVKTDDGYILIDTGVAQQWARLEKELLQAGCLPDKLKLVIITHGDMDHTGNCAELQQKYGARIAIHAGDLAMAKNGERVKRKGKSFLSQLFLWLGEQMGRDFKCFLPDLLLEDGQDLASYGFKAKVLHTPGHTKGSIAILTEAGELFSGDTLSNQSKPSTAMFIENGLELHNSLELLKQTKARIIYPGHGKPFPFETFLSLK